MQKYKKHSTNKKLTNLNKTIGVINKNLYHKPYTKKKKPLAHTIFSIFVAILLISSTLLPIFLVLRGL